MRVKAKCLLLLVGFCLSFAIQAQYSNSWVKNSQQYFKIPVVQEGIYRLTYSSLQAAGFPVDSIDPRFVQILHRGQEQSIYVKGQSDGVFNPSDFIEFYGQKNDGTLDSLLYKPSSAQPHKYYNLYSDTTVYFLTYTFLQRGLRMDSVQFANVNGLAAEPYQLSERLIVFHDTLSQGFTVGNTAPTAATAFDQGEGWTGIPLQPNTSADHTVDLLLNGVTSGPNPKLDLLLQGWDYEHHDLQISVGANSGALRPLAAPSFDGFSSYLVSSDLNWTDIGTDGKMIIRIAALSASTNRYQASASYIKVTFAQSFDWSMQQTKDFRLPVESAGQSYISLTNSVPDLGLWDISDSQNIVRILSSVANTTNYVVPGTSISKKLFTAGVFTTPQIIPVSFRHIDPASADFLIITNKALMKPAAGYADPVKAYAGYRSSAAGGSFDTLVVTIDQLYDQFNFGETSPLAIYSFMKFMAQGNPKYLFLIGKGRDILFSGYQRKNVPSTELRDLVPSAGYPAGDIAFTSGLNGTTYEPAVPTGRLSASTPLQVATYLNKIKQHESQPLQPWAKELLHLSGGGNVATDAFEISYFKAIVDDFKTIAEGPYLGGHVTTKSKHDIGIERISISPAVNQGVNLVTYFGHAAADATEIDIGFVDDPSLGYNNTNKYPAFLFNGCDVGAIFGDNFLFTEDWLMTANKGSRNFIAGSTFGFANELQVYSGLFYNVGFGDSTFIKKGIGDIQKETSRRYLALSSPTIYSVAQVQQMILAGDPSIKLFGTNLPDYSIDNASILLTSLDSKPVTSLSDSFALKIIVKNLGAYNPKPMKVRVLRTFNDNSAKTYDSTFSAVLYSDTLIFKLRKEKSIDGFGNNLFTVIIDPLNTVKEINENNNTATLNYLIPSNGTINLYPPNFGIVNATSINLTFQDANLLGAQRNFLLQIDTTRSFNSSLLTSKTISAKVFAKIPFTLLQTDSTVYFWRTKPVKQNASDTSNWSTSSFVYINGGTDGWAQKKFQQVTDDRLTNLDADTRTSKINFQQTVSAVSVKSIGTNSTSSYQDTSVKIDGVEYNVTDLVPCRNNTINLVAFTKETAVPYAGISYFFDIRGCGLQPPVINSYLSAEIETGNNDMLISIDNIHANDSVILYSIGNPSFSQWSSNVLTKLNDLGISSSQITSLQDGEPVVIFSKKGSPPGSARIFRSSASPATSQDLSVSKTMTGRFSSGNIKSPIIGPANKWISFSPKSSQADANDLVTYSIYGVSLTGLETLLQSGITSNFDLSFINPVQYPLLKVQVDLQDQVNQTAAQLKNWFVIFEPTAEGLLFYQGPLTTQTVQEGQPFSGHYAFANISSKAFSDSLLVRAQTSLTGKGNFQIETFKIKPPAPGDTTKFLFNIKTRGKAGLNDIGLFVNPKIQPEQFYENNGLDLLGYLNVLADRSHPLLDVTIDGRYLQNNDFVSPNPSIQIKLHDDNSYLFINDTTHLSILLSFPCDNAPCPFKRIDFSRSDLKWSPATATTDFVVNFNPIDLPEGSYTLQVTGADESNNSSGTRPFEVIFQVKDQTTLKFNSVFPNPSKDIFNFNFTLAGNSLPDEFSLQIFSNSGKLVQEFGINDVSNFVIGTNNLTWRIPQDFLTGLYIYRLRIAVGGKSFSESGKLVLNR